MSLRRLPFLLIVLAIALLSVHPASAQERKVKEQTAPVLPEMAKSMHLSGAVRVQITITPQGAVKDPKVLGGHPLLADAAVRAVQKWKYENGPEETKVVTFDFKQ